MGSLADQHDYWSAKMVNKSQLIPDFLFFLVQIALAVAPQRC